jgi:drug/metabolite transporter (DMT)-like permease
VVFTPLLGRFFGSPIRWWTWTATAVSLVGLLLLTGGPSGMNVGDLLVLGCAVMFALHTVLLGRWSPGTRTGPLAMVQMAMCAVLFSLGGSWSMRAPSSAVWFALAVTGLVASAFGYAVQTWAQAHISANRTALVLAAEPAWALVAALMLAAIVGHEGATLEFESRGEEPSP